MMTADTVRLDQLYGGIIDNTDLADMEAVRLTLGAFVLELHRIHQQLAALQALIDNYLKGES